MALAQPPERLAELEHSEEVLLRELQRVDEILLEELEHVDEMLLRIAAAIEELPELVVSAIERDQHRSLSGNGTRAAEPARSRGSTRPFDPYGEDEVGVEAAKNERSAAGQVVGKVQSWVAAYAGDREALGLVTFSLTFALLATTIAVVGLIVAVLH
jgi:hypothetical protein